MAYGLWQMAVRDLLFAIPYSLSLPLIVLGILAHDANDALAPNNLALFTALFDRWFDFHDDNSSRFYPQFNANLAFATAGKVSR
jgi:hypothetical protein